MTGRTDLICEVGPRDGLQNAKRVWSVQERVELIDRLIEAGCRRIEAVSFVNPKRVPQMADPEAVLARVVKKDGVWLSGLALNKKGVERAVETPLDEVRLVVVASETFNLKNQGVTIQETLSQFQTSADLVVKAGKTVTGIVGASFGCPFEGEVPVAAVAELAGRLFDLGAGEIILADTIGCGHPSRLRELNAATRAKVGDDPPIGYHLHNSRNTGLANALAAVECGASVLDASIGGIGGCPFAPKATGNIAHEDLAWLLHREGRLSTPDTAKLIDAAKWVEGFFDHPLPGQLMKAGIFPQGS